MTTEQSERNGTQSNTETERRPQPSRSIFTVPTPIKQLFDRFPLLTYPANELPLRAPRHRDAHVLYIFATEEGARNGAPSYNPACLKWQTYLKFNDIPFRLVSSNNHASPSGALPFLLPSHESESIPTELSRATQPVPSAKLQRWTMNNSSSAVEEPGDLRYEAYLSLLDHRIRRAWLYTVYLSPNTTSLAEPLYILPSSTNPFVRLTLAHELRRAAEKELLKHSAVINADILYKEADEAFSALEMALGDDEWFFGNKKPGLFDASVFAYTHLLLDEGLGKGWVDTSLRDKVVGRRKLVQHRERILKAYYADSA
ncbi:hypothetical protein K491DRAFT_765925 [Lophiostoma macrostomum CBS 122681]|uniref:Mitochondrial outer membrane protein n=1 Tax=Lophiostoma macrostomum CBS 122681 TaxID=1314788 RepID=A0A6A6TK99_9PLEO|nr:hypothetical protein K491DRAFT_765925 [Lophiostoma macrostomum CBS 122681]